VLTEVTPCPFLDANAQVLLAEARQTFHRLGLADQCLTGSTSNSYLLTWAGDYTNDALCLLLNQAGVMCTASGLVLEISASQESVLTALGRIAELDATDVEPLLKDVKNLIREKWDWALPNSLLIKSFASSQLDIPNAIALAKTLTA
ncbi:ATP-dependent helicase, partial [Pseudomonas amygdali pv. tabaci]